MYHQQLITIMLMVKWMDIVALQMITMDMQVVVLWLVKATHTKEAQQVKQLTTITVSVQMITNLQVLVAV